MVVDEGLALSLKSRPLCGKFLGCVECIICKALFYKFLGIFAVDALSLALPVWSMRMTLRSRFHHISLRVNAFIRNNAAPVECFDYIFLSSRNEPLGVCILYSYDEIASVLLSIEVVV